jgi:hypothetical protein
MDKALNLYLGINNVWVPRDPHRRKTLPPPTSRRFWNYLPKRLASNVTAPWDTILTQDYLNRVLLGDAKFSLPNRFISYNLTAELNITACSAAASYLIVA